jgi:hypothetical protein
MGRSHLFVLMFHLGTYPQILTKFSTSVPHQKLSNELNFDVYLLYMKHKSIFSNYYMRNGPPPKIFAYNVKYGLY